MENKQFFDNNKKGLNDTAVANTTRTLITPTNKILYQEYEAARMFITFFGGSRRLTHKKGIGEFLP